MAAYTFTYTVAGAPKRGALYATSRRAAVTKARRAVARWYPYLTTIFIGLGLSTAPWPRKP